MLKNFIYITVRNLGKRKLFTTIHVLGLGVAFAATTLLFLTAMFELSYDDFHTNRDRIGLVYSESLPISGKEYGQSMPAPLGPALKVELPSVERLSRFGNGGTVLRHGDKQFSALARFVDTDFLHMFSFPLVEGSINALDGLDNIVITEDMADNLFSHIDVVGQSLEVQVNGQWQTKLVTAVAKNLPANSSLTFNTLLRFEHSVPDYQAYSDNWDHANHSVFIQWVDAKLNPEAFNNQARPFVSTHFTETNTSLKRDGAQPDAKGDYLSLHVLPMKDYHLNELGIGGGGPPVFPWMLLLIAGLILFIAGSNFVNLSLASSFTRAREIGMRKTLGGRRWQLIAQLWGESLLLCLIALLLGISLALLILPAYNANLNYQLTIGQLANGRNSLRFLAVFLVLTAIAGGYPAWVMSCTNTIQTLKGRLQLRTGHSLRNILTVVQFAIAIVLIVGTLVMANQLHYLHTRPLGFNKTEVISIPIGNGMDGETALKRMREELNALPDAVNVSASDINIGRGKDGSASTSRIGFEYEGRTVRSHYQRVDYDYLATLDLRLVAGRDFSREYATDSNAVLINEQMADELGGIAKTLNTTIPLNGGSQVIGVVKDYHFKDLRQAIEPLTMVINPNDFPVEYLFVKVRPKNLAASLATVESVWKKVNPHAEHAVTYLDENTDNQYRRDKQLINIVISGATLAILLSCMGLFAIVLLSINRRVKEIGVRKVLGASVSDIMLLLSRDFVKLIIIGFMFSAPIAWWLTNQWLQTFAYRVDMHIGVLFLGGLIVLFVAMATVTVQSLRAAVANPVESLRDE